MTYEQARPILEGMLYAWAVYRREMPAALPSAVYDQGASPPPRPLPPHSVVENYVLQHESEIRLEGALRRLSMPERTIVWLRYGERARWEQIGRRLHLSRAAVQRRLDRALYALAVLMGMLDAQDEGAAGTGDPSSVSGSMATG